MGLWCIWKKKLNEIIKSCPISSIIVVDISQIYAVLERIFLLMQLKFNSLRESWIHTCLRRRRTACHFSGCHDGECLISVCMIQFRTVEVLWDILIGEINSTAVDSMKYEKKTALFLIHSEIKKNRKKKNSSIHSESASYNNEERCLHINSMLLSIVNFC